MYHDVRAKRMTARKRVFGVDKKKKKGLKSKKKKGATTGINNLKCEISYSSFEEYQRPPPTPFPGTYLLYYEQIQERKKKKKEIIYWIKSLPPTFSLNYDAGGFSADVELDDGSDVVDAGDAEMTRGDSDFSSSVVVSVSA